MSDIQNKNLDTLIKKTTIDYSKVFSMIPSEMIHEKNIAMVCLRNLKYASKLIDSAKSIVVFDDRDAVELWCSGIATYGLKPRFIEWDYTAYTVSNLIVNILDFMSNHEPNEVACVSITRNLYNYNMEDAIAGDAMNKEIMNDDGTGTIDILSPIFRKFDKTFTNPPYDGNAKGGKLYMQIDKALYDSLSSNGNVIAVHPTSVIDGERDEKFSGLYLNDLVKIDAKESFPDAGITTGMGVFIFDTNGKYELYSDELKEKNMSEYELKKWNIYKKIRDGKWKSFSDIDNHVEIRKDAKKAERYNHIWKGTHCVIIPHIYNDSFALASSKWLKPVYEYVNDIQKHIFPLNTKREAVNLIKWSASDVIVFILPYVKINNTHSISTLKMLPLPPSDWNGDDESVMRYLGLTKEEMDFIHEDVKNKGLKAQMKKTESELMEYIEEINK